MGIFCQLCFISIWLFDPWSEVLRFNDYQVTYPYPEMYKAVWASPFVFLSTMKCICQRKVFPQCLCHWKNKKTFLLYVGNYYCFPRHWIVVAHISHASSKWPFPSIMICHYCGSVFPPKGTKISFMFLVYIYWKKVSRTTQGSNLAKIT